MCQVPPFVFWNKLPQPRRLRVYFDGSDFICHESHGSIQGPFLCDCVCLARVNRISKLGPLFKNQGERVCPRRPNNDLDISAMRGHCQFRRIRLEGQDRSPVLFTRSLPADALVGAPSGMPFLILVWRQEDRLAIVNWPHLLRSALS